MALPPTGNTITMLEVRDFFSATYTPITMTQLGQEISITPGTIIPLSSTFGGIEPPFTDDQR